MIHVHNVTKRYETTIRRGWFKSEKRSKLAVQNIHMEINKGQIVGLLGLNGAGKTTTIKMISTLLEPTSGSITIDGFSTVKDQESILKRINMVVGGERMLYWRLTGWENLMYFGRLYGLPDRMVQHRAACLLKELGLMEARDVVVEQYSKGMKQRLQIARGLINNPDYLLMDEPTLGLDVPLARHLRNTIKQMAVQEGKGILLTSHYLNEVEELCDLVYVIDKGQVMMCDSPTEIIRKVAGYERLCIHIAHEHIDRLRLLYQHLHIPETAIQIKQEEDKQGCLISISAFNCNSLLPKFLQWAVREGVDISQVYVEKPSLEDAIVLLSEGGADGYDGVLENTPG
jgi:ABC-2 type transport system ATP-binding protein